MPESGGGVLRLNCGVPESELLGSRLELRGAATVAESPGLISAFGVPSSELETARRIRGGPSLLFEELPDEALEELFDALLLDELLTVSSELDAARRSRGRLGSLSFDELPDELLGELLDELLVLSSELEAARRSWGRLGLLLPIVPDEELPAELLDGLVLLEDAELSDALLGNGCVGSSAASDAMECSSGVPSLTIVIVTAL